jgi:hypothetical protein
MSDAGGGLSAAATTPSRAVVFSGAAAYSISGSTVSLTIPEIDNVTSNDTSGPLEVVLWFTPVQYAGGTINGYETATVPYTTVASPTHDLPATTISEAFTAPPAGTYTVTMALEEFHGGAYLIDDYVNFANQLTVNGGNLAAGGSVISGGTPQTPPTTPTPAGLGPVSVIDTTTGGTIASSGSVYAGPVSGVQSQYINPTADGLNITASSPSWFIHAGAGNDAIVVTSGTNVLDGGTGSNFLTGGSGTDTFFVDDRNAGADIWSTIAGFHKGDAATIWGITPQGSSVSWQDNQGAAGFTGLTLHATAPGKPTASMTLAGYSQADLQNGRLAVSYGVDSSSGSAYLYVAATS